MLENSVQGDVATTKSIFGENKISPQMIEAGIQVWHEWDCSDDYSLERLVSKIYQEMRKARR